MECFKIINKTVCYLENKFYGIVYITCKQTQYASNCLIIELTNFHIQLARKLQNL